MLRKAQQLKSMRQQYHSRTVGGDRHTWDVNKLVEIAKGLPVKDVSLSEIKELDEVYWHDDSGAPATARNIAVHAMLIYQCDLDYPIILDAHGRIMDGMHRCCRALIEGRKTIKAVQFEENPEPHFINVEIADLPHDDPVVL